MRIDSSLFLLAIALAGALAGCGGKVVYEGGGNGGGGVGGSGSSSSASVTPSSGSGLNCGTPSCGAGSDGSCSCQVTCNMQELGVECLPISGGVACACIENGIAINKCQQIAQNACDVFVGCCSGSFFPM